MFGFGKHSRDPLADVKSARRWVASFPINDPLAVHSEVLAELGKCAARTAQRTPAQLEAVFHVDVHTEDLRATLRSQYI